jgi:hypothetical protein
VEIEVDSHTRYAGLGIPDSRFIQLNGLSSPVQKGSVQKSGSTLGGFAGRVALQTRVEIQVAEGE